MGGLFLRTFIAMKYALSILFVLLWSFASGQSQRKSVSVKFSYKLTDVDSTSLNQYYIMNFIGASDSENNALGKYAHISLLSVKKPSPKIGCWDSLRVNSVYVFSSYELYCIDLDGMLMQMGNGGLIYDGKELLEQNRYFEYSEKFSGLLFNSR